MTQNAVAKTEAKRDIRSFIQSDTVKAQLALVLPKHLTADRMARVAVTTIMRVPKLAQCTTESLLNCLMQCSQLGLEPDGRRAHLIPFENRKSNTVECTLIIDWKGLAELALRGGTIAKLHADLVCDKDEFAFDMGEVLHHRINFREPRGEPYAAYAMAVTKTGEKFVQVMTKAEIEAIRDKSQGWYAFKQGWAKQSPWQDSAGEMWKKTAFRRLSKWLPLSPEYRDAIEVDDEAGTSSVTAPTATDAPVFELPPIPEAPAEESPAIEVASASVTPAAEPPPQPTPPKPKSTPINYVKGLRGLLKLASIPEAEFLDFMRATKGWDDSLSGLEDVALANSPGLQAAYDQWNELHAEIVAAKAKQAAK